MSLNHNKLIKPTTLLSYRFTVLVTFIFATVNIYSWLTNQTENIFTGYIMNHDATMKIFTSISFMVVTCLYIIKQQRLFKILITFGLFIQVIQLFFYIFNISIGTFFSVSSFASVVMFILTYTALYHVKFKNNDFLFLCINSSTYIIAAFAIVYYLFDRDEILLNIKGFETLSWNTAILFYVNSISIFELILVRKINRLNLNTALNQNQHPFYYFPLFFLVPIILTVVISLLNILNIIDITASIFIIFIFLNFSIFISIILYAYGFIRYYKDTSIQSLKLEESNKKLSTLNKELNEKNLYLEDFATLTSHNLREPIIALKELSSYYHDCLESNNLNLSEIENMYQSNVENLNYGLNALINYHKFIQDIDNQFPQRINISDSLENTFDELEYLKPDCTDLNTNIDANIELPKSYINNIFSNLITNSFKFKKTSEKLKINVSTYSTKDYFHILYKDNGSGFDGKLHRNDIFKKGKRFHINNRSSSGYGLYYLKLYVSRLNGKIDLFSKVNKGTLVRIKLKHAPNSHYRR